MAKNINLTEKDAKNAPHGGVVVGKKNGQTIVYDDAKVGGWFVGKTHAEGGIKGIDKTTGQPIEVQVGEVIITAPALADQTKREFEGKMMTNREILSKINSDAGGVELLADGGEIPTKMKPTNKKYKFGGKTMTDADIFSEINKCGCEHEKEHLSQGMSLEDIAKKHNVSLESLQKQVEIGIKDESIHAGNIKDHFNTVKDHLVENPTFYIDEQKAVGESKKFDDGGENKGFKYSKKFGSITIFTNIDQEYNGDNYSPFENKGSFKATVRKGDLENIALESKDLSDFNFEWEVDDWNSMSKKFKERGINELELFTVGKIIKTFELRPLSNSSQNVNFDFKKGGEVKENLVKDAKSGNTPARDLNNYNDMLDVQADGKIGGDTGINMDGANVGDGNGGADASGGVGAFADGGGVGKALTSIVSNWNDVPSIWKNTQKVKKVTWSNNPYDKGLYTIVAPFLSHDDLRPNMTGINFDENGITCTDAHLLITLPYPNKEFEGIYNADLSKKKDSQQITIDGKYPNYSAVIPKSKDTTPYFIDVYKLLQYTKVAINYASKYTFAVQYKLSDGIYGMNGKFLIEVLNTLLKLGHEKVYAHFSGFSRAMVFSPTKDYELGNDELLLAMPVMVQDEKLGAFDIDYNRELSVYYDFNDNEIHNANGSVAEFKMTYENNSVVSEEDVKLFEDIIKKSKNRIPILDNVIVENSVARVTNLHSEYELKGVNLPNGIYKPEKGILEITMEAIEDYPAKPIFEVDENTIEFTIPSKVFEYYVDKLKDVVGKDELRPVMMGICLHHTSDNKLFLIGTDAHILLKVDITKYVEMPIYNKDIKTIIDPKFLYDYLNTIEELTLFIKSNKIATKIDSDKWSFYCRNIDGNYVNYDAVIPRENNKLLSVDLNELRHCIDSDFSKKYEKESTNKDGIYVFNHKNEIYLGTYDRYAKNKEPEKIEKLCETHITVKEESYYYQDQSVLLIMPVYTNDQDVDFSFGKKILQRVIGIVSDKKLEMHYTEINRAYLVPIHSFEYEKTTKEHKVKEQTKRIQKEKIDKSEKDKNDIREAIETLVMLAESESDESQRKELYDAIEVLNMLKEESFAYGGQVKNKLVFMPIETPLN